jgi:phage/plasmid-like protein (TIGR03299 family)
MSKESMEWLRTNIRIGYTGERGPAWWANSNEYMTDGSHFEGPVPADEVRRILDVPFILAAMNAVHTEIFHVEDCDNSDGASRCDCPRVTSEYPDPSRKVVVSPDDGHIHGVFKQGWQLHGYQEWTADQLAAILDQGRGELGVASVGLLQQRSVAFLQAKLEGSALEVGGYGFVPFITAATSVNGSLSSTYATGIEGVVCDNTLTAALNSALSKLKIKHSRNSAGKLGEVRDRLGLVYQAADEFSAAAAALQDTPVTGPQFTAWLDEMIPVPDRDPKSSTGGAKYSHAVKVRDTYEAMWSHDPKVKPWAGTAFGILQLDNTYRQWVRNVSGAVGGRLERNMLNMVNGTVAREDDNALAKLASVLERKLVIA